MLMFAEILQPTDSSINAVCTASLTKAREEKSFK